MGQYLVFLKTCHPPQSSASQEMGVLLTFHPVFANTKSIFSHPVALSLIRKSPPSQLSQATQTLQSCKTFDYSRPHGTGKVISPLHLTAVSISNEILLLPGICLKHVIKQIKMSNSNESC